MPLVNTWLARRVVFWTKVKKKEEKKKKKKAKKKRDTSEEGSAVFFWSCFFLDKSKNNQSKVSLFFAGSWKILRE